MIHKMRDIVRMREESLTCERSEHESNASRIRTRSAFDQTLRKFVVKTYFKDITKS